MKLHLNEDADIIIPEVQESPVEETAKEVNNNIATMINSMIKGEWDAIDLYNSMLEFFKGENNEEVIKVVSDIVKEEYIHVGQLEKLLQNMNPLADSIDDGKEETEGQIA